MRSGQGAFVMSNAAPWPGVQGKVTPSILALATKWRLLQASFLAQAQVELALVTLFSRPPILVSKKHRRMRCKRLPPPLLYNLNLKFNLRKVMLNPRLDITQPV